MSWPLPLRVFCAGTGAALTPGMSRKIGVIVAAIILPGGLIALLSAFVIKRLSTTPRGQRVLAKARDSVPAWATSFDWRFGFGETRAAM